MAQAREGPWVRELEDLVRGLSGGFLFGVPLLYTEEVWWLGARAQPWQLLLLLAVGFAASVGLAHASGFRRRTGLAAALADALDALAIGVLGGAAVLLALNRLTPDLGFGAVVGMVAVEAVVLGLGASVANAVFDPRRSREGDAGGQAGGFWRRTAKDLGATATGGLFVGLSIAPTEEVPMLAAGMTGLHLLALVALSLAVTYAIVFESGFDPRGAARHQGAFQRPISETAIAYAVSVLVAAFVLYLLQPATDAPRHMLAQVVVLALPTAVGGAAGRLVI